MPRPQPVHCLVTGAYALWLAATLLARPSQQAELKPDNYHLQQDSSPDALAIIKARGFRGELYMIRSRDGQALSIYHIVNPLADPLRLNKYPVLVWHGISGDSAQMISHSELARPRRPEPGRLTVDPSDTALAFMLANNNFDVWLADARGTNLNNHKVSADLNFLEGNKYWNFSLDEQIHNDVPATLDFVLEQTHEDKLHYIGFSQSTLFIFAFLSKFTEYQAKMASVLTMAPVAFVANIQGIVLPYFAAAALLPDGINGNYLPQPVADTFGVALKSLCQVELGARTICASIGDSVGGVGDNEQSHSFFAASLKSTSLKALKQMLQMYLHKRFGMYDYGRAGNLRQYGRPTPPDYNPANIKLKNLILFRGGQDFLSDYADQQILLSKLGTKPYLDVYYPKFNHLDFIISRDITKTVNVPAVQAMFDLLVAQAKADNSTSGIFRDPAKLRLGPSAKPVAVVEPNGDRSLVLRGNLVGNLITGFSEIAERKIVSVTPGPLLTTPITPSLFHGPNSLLHHVDAIVSGVLSPLMRKK